MLQLFRLWKESKTLKLKERDFSSKIGTNFVGNIFK